MRLIPEKKPLLMSIIQYDDIAKNWIGGLLWLSRDKSIEIGVQL